MKYLGPKTSSYALAATAAVHPSPESVRVMSVAELVAHGKTVCSADVFSHDQRAQLQPPAALLERPCHEPGFSDVEVVSDFVSGSNYPRRICSVCLWMPCAAECTASSL
jgi:predicted site-specific integrase-resolvase